MIPIVYGSRTDWLKNVVASGAAAIVDEGDSYPVDHPEIVPLDSAGAYCPAAIQRNEAQLTQYELLLRRQHDAGASRQADGTQAGKGGVCPGARRRKMGAVQANFLFLGNNFMPRRPALPRARA